MNEIQEAMKSEIMAGLNEIENLNTSGDSYGKSVNNIAILIGRYNDLEKTRHEAQISGKRAKSERINNAVNWGIAILGVTVPAACYMAGVKISNKIEFEANDILTSTAGKESLKKLFSFRK